MDGLQAAEKALDVSFFLSLFCSAYILHTGGSERGQRR